MRTNLQKTGGEWDLNMINIGGSCSIPKNTINCILEPLSAPVRRKIKEWQGRKDLEYIDVTGSNKTKSIIVAGKFVFASSISMEALVRRFEKNADE